MQYALQCRHDYGNIKTPPGRVRHVVLFIARSGVRSLLDWPEETWAERFPRSSAGASSSSRALLVYARRRVEELQHGRGWDVEYPQDVWRLRNLGVDSPHAHLRFGGIPQSWLKELVKRWVRWRISTGICGGQANKCVNVLTRFARFLASPAGGAASLAEIDRPVLERYLADLRALGHGVKSHGEHIGLVNAFFQAIRQHRWDDSLPSTAAFFAKDYPKRPQQLPRALAEHVMAQVERPDNLDRWPDPAARLVTVILMRCGLRVSDAVKLPFDCIVRDADTALYLRYFNHKIKREALVPIDEEVEQSISEQQRRVLERWPQGAPVLFPQPTANTDGHKPLATSTYRRDQHGRPVHLTPHQWRHTFGTRLSGLDLISIQELLGHSWIASTLNYIHVHRTRIEDAWVAGQQRAAHRLEGLLP